METTVAINAGPGQLAAFNDQVLVPDRSTGEIALEHLTGVGGGAGTDAGWGVRNWPSAHPCRE
jgi:hypothetical protein